MASEVEMANILSETYIPQGAHLQFNWYNNGVFLHVDDNTSYDTKPDSLMINASYSGTNVTIFLDKEKTNKFLTQIKDKLQVIEAYGGDNIMHSLNEYVGDCKDKLGNETYNNIINIINGIIGTKRWGSRRKKKSTKAKKSKKSKKIVKKRKVVTKKKVHTGPRGGKYVVVKGKKRYL